jgi:hypothetical protein
VIQGSLKAAAQVKKFAVVNWWCVLKSSAPSDELNTDLWEDETIHLEEVLAAWLEVMFSKPRKLLRRLL